MLWKQQKTQHSQINIQHHLKKKKKLIGDCNRLVYELACKFKNVVKLLFFVVFLALLEK